MDSALVRVGEGPGLLTALVQTLLLLEVSQGSAGDTKSSMRSVFGVTARDTSVESPDNKKSLRKIRESDELKKLIKRVGWQDLMVKVVFEVER